MEIKKGIEDFAAKKIAHAISDLLGHVSDENLIRLTYLNYLSPRNRKIIFETFFYRACFIGNRKRDAFERENGFRPPFVMILSPTYRCNLRCKGCYTLGYGTKPELPYEIVDSILKECDEMGINFVTVLGGEPLVYPHLFRMIEEHPEIFFQEYLYDARVLVGSSATVTSENVYTVSCDEFVDHMLNCGSFLQNYYLYIPVNGKADFSLMVTP